MTANQIRRVIPSQKQALSDAELIDLVQRRQTFLYFFGTGCIHRAALRAIAEGSIRIQRMMQSRSAVQALAAWPSSSQGKRMDYAGGRRSASCAHARSPLERATCHQGHFPHFMNGAERTMAADIVETSFLFQGLLRGRGGFFEHIGEAIYFVTTSCFYVGYARCNH